MTNIFRTGLLPVLLTMIAAQAAAQDDWTTLKGRLVYSGPVPQPEKLDITRDEEYCGQFDLVDETLVVNQENRGLKNVVIWLYSKSAEVPVHESYAAAAAKPVTLDNENCRFEPRMVTLRTGQTLQATNSDPVAHNVAVYALRNSPFSIVVPQNQPLEHKFEREELLPVRVDCSIHAWMKAHILITEHPYAVVTDKDGRFEIPQLPAGKWQFRFWHERPGYLPAVTQDGQKIELERGTWEIDLSGDVQDLGDLTVDSSGFAEED